MNQRDLNGGKFADGQPKFHTLQLFVWETPAKELLSDIFEAPARHADIIRDYAKTHITSGDGEYLEIYVFDGAPNALETKELGAWQVVWDLPERCRRERPCVVIDGAVVDLVKFIESRS